MTLRVRENWSTIRADIRRLLRETDAAASYWTDVTLLMLFNDALDKRFLEMVEEDEGWAVDEYTTSLVANQREYELPDGADRVRRVWLITVDGGNTSEIEVRRDERPFDGVVHGASNNAVAGRWYRPTYRLLGELLVLEPRPDTAVTNGLRVEFEAPQPKLTGDASKIPARYPVVLETLLKYDTAIKAFALENNQDRSDEGYIVGLREDRDAFEKAFKSFIARRQSSVTFSRPLQLGD
jgi:hypothetical protein